MSSLDVFFQEKVLENTAIYKPYARKVGIKEIGGSCPM